MLSGCCANTMQCQGQYSKFNKATCNVLHLPTYEGYCVIMGTVVYCYLALLIATDKVWQLLVLEHYMVCKRLLTHNHLLQII